MKYNTKIWWDLENINKIQISNKKDNNIQQLIESIRLILTNT